MVALGRVVELAEKSQAKEGYMGIFLKKLKTPEELAMIPFLDGPWRNDACIGYAIIAMKRYGLTEPEIEDMIREIRECFDCYTVKEAADRYYEF